MTFGQSSGPPATGKQIRELLDLLVAAGHSDFRDARGPLGFTQRQAGGKFTRDEADAFIERLESEAHGDDAGTTAATRPPSRPRDLGAESAGSDLAAVPAALLAAELQRRGWIVVEP